LEFDEDLVFATPEDVRHNLSRLMVHGMPEPTRVVFVANERPHFVPLRFTRSLNVNGHLIWVSRAQQRGVHRLSRRFFLLELAQHGVGADAQ